MPASQIIEFQIFTAMQRRVVTGALGNFNLPQAGEES